MTVEVSFVSGPVLSRHAAEIAETIYRLDGPLRWAIGENERLADLAEIDPAARVLDVGAGTGYLTLPLARRLGAGGRVDAVDTCPELLERMMSKASRERLDDRVSPHVAPADKLPFDDAVFDAVLSSYLLHELGAAVPAMLADIARVLRPGGRVVLADFRRVEDEGRRSEIEAWYCAQRDGDGAEGQHLRFSLRELECWLIDAGFRELRLSTWAYFHMHAVARR